MNLWPRPSGQNIRAVFLARKFGPQGGWAPRPALSSRRSCCWAGTAGPAPANLEPLRRFARGPGETRATAAQQASDASFRNGLAWSGQFRATARLWPRAKADGSDPRGHENVPGTLLPNLLPNAVARDGTRTDRG